MTDPAPGLSFRQTPEGIEFWIHASPRARRARVGGLRVDALRVSVREPPLEGRANAACAEALARALGVPRSAVALDPGSQSRRKRVRVTGDPEALPHRLRELAASGDRAPRKAQKEVEESMPIYEYTCEKCGHEFEREQRITDDPIKTCPSCKAPRARRLISRTSFVLKGGGWYNDLYASSKTKEKKTKADEKPAEAGGGGDAKKEKPAAKPEKKVPSKPKSGSDPKAAA